MKQKPALGELITFQNSRGFNHDGILYRTDNAKTTIIHVHGSYGNFYQQQFLRIFAKIFQQKDVNFLSFNLTGHDGFGDAYHFDDFGYEGGALSDFSTCLDDIEAAIKFAARFSETIVLQGHSLGCDRVVHYLIESENNLDFILLSPCDSYQLQVNHIFPEKVEEQIARLKSRQMKKGYVKFDWLPIEEYGVTQGKDWTYPNPITSNALLSILEGPPFYLFRLSQHKKYWINQRCLVYIGGMDNLQTAPSEEMFSYLENRIKNVSRLFLPHSDHGLKCHEEDVAKAVLEWLSV